MSLTESVRTCLRKYATFTGRARRSEYWYFQLFQVVVSLGGLLVLGVVAGVTEVVTGATGADDPEAFDLVSTVVVGVFLLIYFLGLLALVLPTLAVTVRRLHDTDRSGWWWWIGLVPLAGPIVLLVFTVLDSGPDNRFGPWPKGSPYGGGYPPPGQYHPVQQYPAQDLRGRHQA